MSMKKYCYECLHWCPLGGDDWYCGNKNISEHELNRLIDQSFSKYQSDIHAAEFCPKFTHGGMP